MPNSKQLYIQDIRKASELVQRLLEEDANFAAGCLRLCIHDAFAFDVKKRLYGVNASIRTQKELSHRGNEGLDEIVAKLANVKSVTPNISFADLYQLAGIEAIASKEGPRVPFTPGRKDGWTFPPQTAYFSPNTGNKPLEEFKKWVERTGLPLQSAVALLGVHSIARWWSDNEKAGSREASFEIDGPFDNSYFRKLLSQDIVEDAWLLGHDEIRKHIEEYASSQERFFEDYIAAHEQLSLLGTNLLSEPIDLSSTSEGPEYVITATEYAVYAAGVVAGSAAVAYGLWRWRQRYLRSGKLFS